MGIIWVASYPKSGNTWLRFLIANAVSPSAITSAGQVSRIVPDLHVDGEVEKAIEEGRETLFVKTHLSYSEHHPFLDLTRGFVYIARRPEDVMLSNHHYHALSDDAPPVDQEIPIETYARYFINAGGDPRWTQMGFGTMPDHASSWLDAPVNERVVSRYEDMMQDPTPILTDVLSLMNTPLDTERVTRAVRNSTFDQMRAIEVREKANPKSGQSIFAGGKKAMRKGRYFMNTGRTGQSLENLDASLRAQFEERFAPFKKLFDYT